MPNSERDRTEKRANRESEIPKREKSRVRERVAYMTASEREN